MTTTSAPSQPRIVGTGHALPKSVRYNDDPIFDALKKRPDHDKLFQGFHKRHYLRQDETLDVVMAPAARDALHTAGIKAGEIDLLLGCGSISKFVVPNVLSKVHRCLDMSAQAWPLPLMNSFSQVPAAVMMADSLLRAGRFKKALLVFGDNWTKFMDYATPQSISAGDGAAAMVITPSDDPAGWYLVDQMVDVDTSYYGSMFMAGAQMDGEEIPPDLLLEDHSTYSHPFFQITDKGVEGFRSFGADRAPVVAKKLLEKHGIASKDVCLVSHQASTVLMDRWAEVIAPGRYISTLRDVGNLVLCSVAYNMSDWLQTPENVTEDWLVSLCLGPDMHASAMLYRRG